MRPGVVARIVGGLGLAVLAAGLSGCAALRASQAPVRPPLDAPEPPPREIAAAPIGDPGSPPPTPVVVPAAPVSRPARHAPKPAEKPEPPPVPPPETPAPKAAEAPGSGAALSTEPDTQAAERRVRERIARAARDLKQVDQRQLSPAARTQLDAARRFLTQAEDALAAKNVRFAEQLAEKAAGIAAGLLAR